MEIQIWTVAFRSHTFTTACRAINLELPKGLDPIEVTLQAMEITDNLDWPIDREVVSTAMVEATYSLESTK